MSLTVFAHVLVLGCLGWFPVSIVTCETKWAWALIPHWNFVCEIQYNQSLSDYSSPTHLNFLIVDIINSLNSQLPNGGY